MLFQFSAQPGDCYSTTPIMVDQTTSRQSQVRDLHAERLSSRSLERYVMIE